MPSGACTVLSSAPLHWQLASSLVPNYMELSYL